MKFRFNHMELTFAPGTLRDSVDEIKNFYGEVFGAKVVDLPMFDGQLSFQIQLDEFNSQFLVLVESNDYMQSPGYDHLGMLCDSRADVDALRGKIKTLQAKDSRIQIKDYDDFKSERAVTRAFYFKHLLPIWFDVQVIEFKPEHQQSKSWKFN
jgi:extradiol dioxygenase family protein